VKIQGGDPTGTGRGGESAWGKPFKDDISERLKHDARGVLSMANSGLHSNRSQFFILFAPQPHLDNKHSVFGMLVKGFDVLDKIERIDTGHGSKRDSPVVEIKILTTTIISENPFDEPWEPAYLRKAREKTEREEHEREERRAEDAGEMITWFGTAPKSGSAAAMVPADAVPEVGKYLKSTAANANASASSTSSRSSLSGLIAQSGGDIDDISVQPAKKRKAAGFGNFDSW